MSITQLRKAQTELTKFWIGQTQEISKLAKLVDVDGCTLYGKLVSFGLHDLMTSVFPVCAKLLGEDEFSHIVDGYLQTFPPNHQNLNQVAHRFAHYLQIHCKDLLSQYQFLAELADYEWLELEVLEHKSNVIDIHRMKFKSINEFIQLKPIINPTLKLRKYNFAIPTLVDRFLESGEVHANVERKPISLVAYRHPQTLECKFLELAKIGEQIIELTVKQTPTYKELLLSVLNLSTVREEDFALEFVKLIEKFHELKLFVGEINNKREYLKSAEITRSGVRKHEFKKTIRRVDITI